MHHFDPGRLGRKHGLFLSQVLSVKTYVQVEGIFFRFVFCAVVDPALTA